MWSHLSSTQHADYAHYTSRTVPEHCHAAQHAAWIQIKAMWRQSGIWILIPDPHQIQGPVWRASLYFAMVCDLIQVYLKYSALIMTMSGPAVQVWANPAQPSFDSQVMQIQPFLGHICYLATSEVKFLAKLKK